MCFVISIASQIFCIFSNYFMAKALGIDIVLGHMFVFVPLVLIINAIPISLGGWGVGECAYAFLLALVGIGPDRAVALSVIYKIGMIIISIPGGIIFAIGLAKIK
jgi:hypothetical protein